MTVAIRYFSRGGNTKKLADAISSEIGIEAKTVKEKLTEDVDILFLGSSVYAYGVDDAVKEFIRGIDVKVGKVVSFSTAALITSTYKQVNKLLKEKNITMSEKEFACKGSFGPMHKGKPDENDVKAVKEFARQIISESK